jgi:HlyD family secretion protein
MFSRPSPYYMILSLLFISCSNSIEEILPERRDISESVYASGKVVSKNQYEVIPNANGTIQEIFVSEGDTVEIGSPILTVMDASTLLNREMAALAKGFSERQQNMARLKELEINISLAKRRMENDSLLYVRQQNLYEKGIGTKIELEQRKLAWENSVSDYQTSLLSHQELERQITYNEKNASKNLELARAMESDLMVKSKIKGQVYALLKEKGEMVNAQTPVAVLGASDEFVLELQVDEYDIVRVEKNQKVKVSMDSYRSEVFDALITKINPMMDERSKSFIVEALFIDGPPRLYPNLTLEANIIIQVKEGALLVPSNYIMEDKFIISQAGDTLAVTLGIKNYQYTEILEGIDENTVLLKP